MLTSCNNNWFAFWAIQRPKLGDDVLLINLYCLLFALNLFMMDCYLLLWLGFCGQASLTSIKLSLTYLLITTQNWKHKVPFYNHYCGNLAMFYQHIYRDFFFGDTGILNVLYRLYGLTASYFSSHCETFKSYADQFFTQKFTC